MNPKKRLRANNKPVASTSISSPPTTASTAKAPSTSPIPKVSPPPNQYSRHSTPIDTTITYYNYNKPGHFTSSCPELKKIDFKAIKEELSEYDLEPEKEEPQEKTPLQGTALA